MRCFEVFVFVASLACASSSDACVANPDGSCQVSESSQASTHGNALLQMKKVTGKSTSSTTNSDGSTDPFGFNNDNDHFDAFLNNNDNINDLDTSSKGPKKEKKEKLDKEIDFGDSEIEKPNNLEGFKEVVTEVVKKALKNIDTRIKGAENENKGLLKVGRIVEKNRKYLDQLYKDVHLLEGDAGGDNNDDDNNDNNDNDNDNDDDDDDDDNNNDNNDDDDNNDNDDNDDDDNNDNDDNDDNDNNDDNNDDDNDNNDDDDDNNDDDNNNNDDDDDDDNNDDNDNNDNNDDNDNDDNNGDNDNNDDDDNDDNDDDNDDDDDDNDDNNDNDDSGGVNEAGDDNDDFEIAYGEDNKKVSGDDDQVQSPCKVGYTWEAKEKYCQGNPPNHDGKQHGNLGTFDPKKSDSRKKCIQACLQEEKCITGLYEYQSGQCTFYDGCTPKKRQGVKTDAFKKTCIFVG